MKHKKFNEVKPYVYLIESKISGQKYFGSRYQNFTRHKTTPAEDLGKKYFSSNKIISKEFKKNKKNFIYKPVFTFDSIEETLKYELEFNKKIIRDKKWLNRAAFPAIIHTEEIKKEYSERMKGKGNPNFGKKLSDEYKKKISLSTSGEKHHFFGKKHSADSKDKQRRSNTGKKRSKKTLEIMKKAHSGKNNAMFGRKHSPETIEKMRVAAKLRKKRYGQKFSVETRKKLSEKAKERFSNKSFKEKHRESIKRSFKDRVPPMLGVKHSVEAKNKIRAAKLGKKLTLEHKLKLKEARSNRNNI